MVHLSHARNTWRLRWNVTYFQTISGTVPYCTTPYQTVPWQHRLLSHSLLAKDVIRLNQIWDTYDKNDGKSAKEMYQGACVKNVTRFRRYKFAKSLVIRDVFNVGETAMLRESFARVICFSIRFTVAVSHLIKVVCERYVLNSSFFDWTKFSSAILQLCCTLPILRNHRVALYRPKHQSEYLNMSCFLCTDGKELSLAMWMQPRLH